MDILARPEVLWLLLVLVLLPLPPSPRRPPDSQRPADPMAAARETHGGEQIAARDVTDPRVLAAMRQVPRHLFVLADEQASAYDDRPLPIGHGQTISPAVHRRPDDRAGEAQGNRPCARDRHRLRLSGGSPVEARRRGVQHRDRRAARVEAKARLARVGCTNVITRIGDGYGGWPEKAPFDLIVVTAAPDHVPPPLIAQLRPGGRLVIPVGEVFSVQELVVIGEGRGREDPHGADHPRAVRAAQEKVLTPAAGGASLRESCRSILNSPILTGAGEPTLRRATLRVLECAVLEHLRLRGCSRVARTRMGPPWRGARTAGDPSGPPP